MPPPLRFPLALAALVASAATAQARNEAATPSCSPKAALYAVEKGAKVWITRRGRMEFENPLRPLTPERLVVYQVVVNGRIATAYGPDASLLRQGGAPQQLEREVAPIKWQGGADGLPGELRIVAEDGRVLVGALRFVECAEAPSAKVVAPRRPDPKSSAAADGRAAPTAAERNAARQRPGFPQGAVEGLTLPQGRGN